MIFYRTGFKEVDVSLKILKEVVSTTEREGTENYRGVTTDKNSET